MHAINFYPNFVPIQELSDWFEHWSTQGVKPAFMCEYGAPFTWDWTMYRGFYKGQREFGSAAVPWEFCLSEWNAQFLGDKAFAISEAEKANLRWEARQFRDGKLWHRWDYPVEVGSSRLTERYPVFATYLKDNWRAFRTWGVSAISPWEYEHFWKLRDGVDRKRKEFKTDWQGLQRPGFAPDYEDQRYERMDLAYERSDWVPTQAAQALVANNRPLLAYLAGKPAAFTSKDHLFRPGDAIDKQLIVINNSRTPITADCECQLQGLSTTVITRHVSIAPGQQERVPIRFNVPLSIAPVSYVITASVKFDNGERQNDDFMLEVVPKPRALTQSGRTALYDPKGETTKLLKEIGWRVDLIDADAGLSNYDLLIVGKGALTLVSKAPDIKRVRDGLKIIIFEQSSEVLEKRLGFRVEEYGLRQVFPRIPDHPVLAGVAVEQLRDWRGEATLLPPRLKYESRPRYGPTVAWCGIPVPHLWRCGNRGNVASVPIEKPMSGDFLPIVDGGYSLQYSPLLEYHEGKGMVLFCQLDVTARNEPEPVADILVHNLLLHATNWKPSPRKQVLYAGETRGNQHLEAVGIATKPYDPAQLTTNTILLASPGGGQELAGNKPALASFLQTGGTFVGIGLAQDELNSFLPHQVETLEKEHISAFFDPFGFDSFGAGIGPADLHNRDPRKFPLVTGGARIVADGILAEAEKGRVVLCQIPPWEFGDEPANLKRTHRRASFALSRLLGNLGADFSTPLLERFHNPVVDQATPNRCLSGLYIDKPEEWDDPYRHFRW
jgi:hypothetical protein